MLSILLELENILFPGDPSQQEPLSLAPSAPSPGTETCGKQRRVLSPRVSPSHIPPNIPQEHDPPSWSCWVGRASERRGLLLPAPLSQAVGSSSETHRSFCAALNSPRTENVKGWVSFALENLGRSWSWVRVSNPGAFLQRHNQNLRSL